MKILIKNILTAVSLLFLSTTANAQENGFLGKVSERMDKMTQGKFDPEYVSAPKYKWMVFTSANFGYNMLDMQVPLDIQSYPEFPDFEELGIYRSHLHQGTRSFALGMAYGIIRAQYAFNIGSKMDRQFRVDALGSKFGGFLDYHHSTKMEGTFVDAAGTTRDRLFDPYPDNIYSTQELIDMNTEEISSDRNDYQTLHAQLHYVFNYRKFSFSATRTATRIQKKSAGSPILVVDFFQSKANFEDALIYGDSENYRTWKVSVGGGYAYSYTPNAGKVLLHASVMPTLSLFAKSYYSAQPSNAEYWISANYIWDHRPDPYPYANLAEFEADNPEEYAYYRNEYSQFLEDAKEDIRFYDERLSADPKLMLNCTARISATWNINEHFVLGGYASAQYTHYGNKKKSDLKEHNFSGYVFLGYRF